MKSITEFPNFLIAKAAKAKEELLAAGKAVEEIHTHLGETFKYEGEKLKHFVNAVEVAVAHLKDLKRVVVLSLAEGENAPPRAKKIEEFHYVPEPIVMARPAAAPDKKGGKGGRGGRGGNDRGGKKESPWGLSPEEKAAKKAKGGSGTPPANKPS